MSITRDELKEKRVLGSFVGNLDKKKLHWGQMQKTLYVMFDEGMFGVVENQEDLILCAKLFGIWYCAENFETRGYKTDQHERKAWLPPPPATQKWWEKFIIELLEKYSFEGQYYQYVYPQLEVLRYRDQIGAVFERYIQYPDSPLTVANWIIQSRYDYVSAAKREQERFLAIRGIYDKTSALPTQTGEASFHSDV